MKTRLLETQDVFRATVKSAEVVERGESFIELRTAAVQTLKKAVSSADSEMVNRGRLAGVGSQIDGRLRVDVLADDVLRVRYAEGTAVPENVTPMVVGEPKPPQQCDIDLQVCTAGAVTEGISRPAGANAGEPVHTVVMTTGKLRVEIGLNPYRVEVRDRQGRMLCGIGGPEKDYFYNWDALNTGLCRTRADGSPLAVECFDLGADEAVFGFGEKFIKLNKVGQTIDLNMVDALGVTTPRSYKNIPFYMSTRGYGVFFNHSSLMTCWVGSRSAADVQVAAEDEFLDYYLFFGDLKHILDLYTQVTGRGVLPPKWTFGYWQSKISYKSAEETLEIARQMREHEIPCDVIHLDTHWFKQDWYCDLEFDRERFPDPKAYLDELRRLGIKVSLWQLPYVPSGSRLFEELKAVDGFVKRADGSLYDSDICFVGGFRENGGVVGIVDYTNPAAVKVHQDAFRRLFRLGAKVIKTDFGEAAPLDGVYHDGTPGTHMHNLYPLLYNDAVFEVTKEETGDGVVWARSAWAGSQRYPIHWGGDNSPNWFNIIPQIEGGLSFGMSGFQFWSQDIGGFCGTTNDELLIRWMQLGMFISHSRIHGFGDRELYKFAPDTLRICRDYIRLRYQLMPYIYGMAARCVEQSVPMMRPLVLEFPDDPTTWNIGDQFLFGDSFLVAPIYSPSKRRRVYLPAGEWLDWWTQERIPGGRWIEVTADLETLPLYVREGAVIPMGPVMPYVDAEPTRELTLRVVPFAADGETRFSVPLDGEWLPVTYTAAQNQHTLTVGCTEVRVDVQVLGQGRVQVVRK